MTITLTKSALRLLRLAPRSSSVCPRPWGGGCSVLALLLLASCASPTGRAPVEERAVSRTSTPAASSASQPRVLAPAKPAATAAVSSPMPPTPPQAKDVPRSGVATDAAPGAGGYVVKAGDTLLRIALDHGQNWRDIARWNGLENPNLIEVGQVLRVSPLASEGAVAEPKPVTLSGQVETRPLATSPAASGSAPPAAQARAQAPPVAPDAVSSGALEAIDWGWPAAGPLISPYEEGRGLKGLSLGGKLGDPVLAAADGRVIYAGAGLRGYGNLVIVRHNGNFLSAYAHNQNLLVKEDQAVRKGQRIADMGSSDTDRVKLHFEIRRNGLPVDPARYLPAR